MGKVIEDTNVFSFFDSPTHPYSKALLAATPKYTDPKSDLIPVSEEILNSITNLRYDGVICELYPSNVKIKKQLDYANKKNFDFVVLIGEDEIKNDSFVLKNMSSGEQSSYKMNTIEDQIKKLI